MNASQFMDKQQIMGLSGAQGYDFLGPSASPAEGHHRRSNGAGAGKDEDEEEILPSYDFQAIGTVGSSPPLTGLDGGRAWGSADSKTDHHRNYGSLQSHESKVIHEKARDTYEYDTTTVVEIDHTIKKYSDNLLHALEGVSSRLSQLESRTRRFESVVDDLKVDVGNNDGNTDGKLRQLENILNEVQTGLQFLRDKQEIAEAQVQLAKLQTSKGEHQPPETPNTKQPYSQKQHVPPQQQHLQQPPQTPVAPLPPHQLPALPAPPAPNAPPPPPPQQNPPVQFPPQIPLSQIPSIPSLPPQEPYYPPPGRSLEDTQQRNQPPAPRQSQLPPPPQHYHQPPHLPQYPQPPQPSQPINPPQLQPPLPHLPEESSPYIPPPQTYPPSICQAPQLSSGNPSSQQYGSSTNMYESPTSRPVSGLLYGPPFLPTGYTLPSGPSNSDSYPYSGSPSHYGSTMKPSPFPSSGAPSGGSNNYPRLPTAQVLPQAPPMGSGSGGASGNRVPIDDVVDGVMSMGFPRDLVRATVRKLMENGQSVDLNVVLDKLMNDGEHQPQKGWLGR